MPYPRRLQKDGLWCCSKCREWLPPERFYAAPQATSGLTAECRSCNGRRKATTRDFKKAAEYSRSWRRRPEVLERERARSAVRRQTKEWQARAELNKAVKRGDLVRPSTCSKCGEAGRIEGHHPDYDRPLDVVWLCADCHERHHVEARRTA